MTSTVVPTPPLGRAACEVSIGSLCTGYAGLDMGVAAALGGSARLAWASDHDPHITHLLTHRFPGVPNLGDLAAVRWSRVEPVDVLTAGFPCQDISAAGRGLGIEKGERSSVWRFVMDAVRHLRPHLLVLENVAALRWRGRGFDRVLTDLARAGYDAHWCCVRASDIGAPHRRERVFVVAHPLHQRRTPGKAHARRTPQTRPTGPTRRGAVSAAPHPCVRTDPHCVQHQRRSLIREAATHATGERRCERKSPAGGFARQPQLALRGHRHAQRQGPPQETAPFAYAWGDYEPALRRWEQVLGKAAPPPTEAGTRGQPRLGAGFVEWMMGLPPGWVTDPALGMPRTAQLHGLGNGVVPQQAAAAVRHLLHEMADAGPGGVAWD